MEEKAEKNHPTVSVIVPVYKVEKYLLECVNSILKQTYTDFELILVNDGSPDRCGEMCDDFAREDHRICVIHQENQGLSGARNAGMDFANGEYITFVDSDDIVSVQYLALLLKAIEDFDTNIAICRTVEFTDKEKLSLCSLTEKGFFSKRVISGKEACVMLYNGEPEVPINAWGKLFCSSLIYDLRFPVGKLHEDQAFTPLVCYRAEKVVTIDAKLYYYRVRDDSITGERFTKKRYDDLWALDRCIAVFKEQDESEILNAAYRKRKRLLAAYSIYARRDGVEVPVEYRMRQLPALLYLRKNVQPLKYQYYLAQVSPKIAYLYEYKKKIGQLLRRKSR